MTQNEFKYVLQSLRYSFRKPQDYLTEDILTLIRNFCEEDIQEIFGLLNSTPDMDLQVKLFSILAAHMLSTDNNNEVIVTYRPLYDRIQDVLSSGHSHRTTTTLNFVTALFSVYNDEESPSPRKKSLALFARNMIRISGCLATMCSMFTSCMMYQDTWFALCHCLAEACRYSEINQNYCTHLVPTCLKKCQQVNAEVCSLLECLLHNSDRNIQIFLDNDGLSIFTRDLLQDNRSMQLLNTILSKSIQAVTLLRNTHIPPLLYNLEHSQGIHPKIGQWAKIVLHHFDASLRTPPYSENKIKNNVLQGHYKVVSHQEEVYSPERASVRSRQCSSDETAKLFQNVIKEVRSWKTPSKSGIKKPLNPLRKPEKLRFNCKLNDNFTPPFSQKRMPKNDDNEIKGNYSLIHRNFNVSKDMSFSFLLMEDFHNPNKNGDSFRSLSKPITNDVTTQTEIFTKTEAYGFVNREMNNTHETEQKSILFVPVHSSTPKSNFVDCNKTTFSRTSQTSRSRARTSCSLKKCGIRKPKKREQVNTIQEIENRSLTSRLFSVINDSCTTLVKSVKSIFKPKEDFQHKNKLIERRFSNNSFTSYMRRRDALLGEKCNEPKNARYHDYSTERTFVNSCRTCDDTIILKQKLENNDYLKQTLKKLKLGVNLYGCDFKKISMSMWPQEKYMTANVLYNLYRKLIVKNKDC